MSSAKLKTAKRRKNFRTLFGEAVATQSTGRVVMRSSGGGDDDDDFEGSRNKNAKALLAVSLAESVYAIATSHGAQQFVTSPVASTRGGPATASTRLIGSGKEGAKGSKVSRNQRRLFLAIFMCLYFIGAAIFSIPAPFFPTRAMEKGVSQTMAGIILGSMQLVQFIAAVILAIAMFHFGLKFMLGYGILWAASCSLLFGIMDLGPNDLSYPVICLIVRLVQGVGVSAYYISASTIASVLFSEKLAFTIGMLQTFYSIGCLAGPSIGGALYSIGGYICPFAVMGLILMAFAPVIAVIIPSDVVSSEAGEGHDSPIRVFKIMICPALFSQFYTMLVGTMTTVFTETTLGVRLAYFNITDPLVVGCVYLASSGAYGITAPIAGRITDKYDAGWLVMFIGTCMSIVGYILIGPSPIFGGIIPEGIVQLIIGCLIAHSGIACCLIPMTREIQRIAKSRGLPGDDPATLSFVSAYFDSCWGMGGFLGAYLAGALMEHLGFPMASTIQAFVLVPSLGMQLYLWWKFKHCKACCGGHDETSDL